MKECNAVPAALCICIVTVVTQPTNESTKLKVKLSLCRPCRHMAEKCIAELIPIVGARWRCFIIFISQSLYPQGQRCQYSSTRGPCRFHSQYGYFERNKNFLPPPAIMPGFLCHLYCCLAATAPKLSSFFK